ncbi:uncharacterized protein [Melanerpes formicivorus]|uniref:uncharacterized protein isoform X1 n=1 Tax=Melanerpes formicivorus TaxID=211600 RepID=UPI00358E7285
MKTTLVTLLAAVLCVEQAYPFMCYVCQEEESNKDCLTISMCEKEDKYCMTILKHIETNGSAAPLEDQKLQQALGWEKGSSTAIQRIFVPINPECSDTTPTEEGNSQRQHPQCAPGMKRKADTDPRFWKYTFMTMKRKRGASMAERGKAAAGKHWGDIKEKARGDSMDPHSCCQPQSLRDCEMASTKPPPWQRNDGLC